MKKRERELIKSSLEYALSLHMTYVMHEEWEVGQSREVITVTLAQRKKLQQAILLAETLKDKDYGKRK